MKTPEVGRIVRRTMIWPGVISIALWAVALTITGVLFVGVSESARAASEGAVIPAGFVGLPLFEGFHDGGRFGVHLEWGLLVMLIGPAIVGIVLSLVAVARETTRD
ncbi:transcriptional regulator [uncultured Microbacterium sp.]|uniref:transcriptional regulator n=1 Tax=uncultured Microbacterium sp. TaxID=191216 RepID=UPI0025CF1DC9|nr:transcriptional regulator [uncultured Microbacterium sp.]